MYIYIYIGWPKKTEPIITSTKIYGFCFFGSPYIYIYIYTPHTDIHTHTHTHTHTYIYIYIYMCVCVGVCIYMCTIYIKFIYMFLRFYFSSYNHHTGGNMNVLTIHFTEVSYPKTGVLGITRNSIAGWGFFSGGWEVPPKLQPNHPG